MTKIDAGEERVKCRLEPSPTLANIGTGNQ